MSMTQEGFLDLQARYSGPGHGAGSPYMVVGLALITMLCMPLQHVIADSGKPPCSAPISMQVSKNAEVSLYRGPSHAASSLQSCAMLCYSECSAGLHRGITKLWEAAAQACLLLQHTCCQSDIACYEILEWIFIHDLCAKIAPAFARGSVFGETGCMYC